MVALKLSLEELEDGGRRKLFWCSIVVGGCGLSLLVTWAVMATCPLQRSQRRCDKVATVQFSNWQLSLDHFYFRTSFSWGPAGIWEQVHVTNTPRGLRFKLALLTVSCWHLAPLKRAGRFVVRWLSPLAAEGGFMIFWDLVLWSCLQPPDWLGPSENVEKDESNSLSY